MPERIIIQCAACGTKSAIGDDKLGRRVRCPKCSEIYVAEAMSDTSRKPKPAPVKKPRRPARKRTPDSRRAASYSAPAAPAALPPRARSGSTARTKGSRAARSGKNESSSMLPLVIAGGICVVLVVGAGLFTLFRGGTEEPVGTTNTQSEQMQPVASTASAVQANNDVAEPNQVVDAREVQTPLDGANPVSVSIPSATDVGSDDIRPPGMIAAESEYANKSARFGESRAIRASDAEENSASGVQSILGRTRWCWAGGMDDDMNSYPAIEVIIDVKTDFLTAVCDFEVVDVVAETFGSALPLRVYNTDLPGYLLKSGRKSPYGSDAESGMYGHPQGWLRVVLLVAIPEDTVTGLKVEGRLLVRVGAKREDIQIEDVRTTAAKPLEHPSLRAADARLVYGAREVSRRIGIQEVVRLAIGSDDYAVGKLFLKSANEEFWLKPQYQIRVPGSIFSNEGVIVRFPEGRLDLSVPLFSELSERSIPFRFDNLPMPAPDKKPKR